MNLLIQALILAFGMLIGISCSSVEYTNDINSKKNANNQTGSSDAAAEKPTGEKGDGDAASEASADSKKDAESSGSPEAPTDVIITAERDGQSDLPAETSENPENADSDADNSNMENSETMDISEGEEIYAEEDEVTEVEREECLSNSNAKAIKIVSNNESYEASADTMLLIKIVGNVASVDIKFNTLAEGERHAGICIFAAGNQADININIDGSTDSVVYIARGNAADLNLEIGENGTLSNFEHDIRGNAGNYSVNAPEKITTCTKSGKKEINGCDAKST